MKQLQMLFQGAVLTFQVTYQCPDYIFCECPTKPECRGFFTTQYVSKNKQ